MRWVPENDPYHDGIRRGDTVYIEGAAWRVVSNPELFDGEMIVTCTPLSTKKCKTNQDRLYRVEGLSKTPPVPKEVKR